MRRFVGVDVGVFDDDFSGYGLGGLRGLGQDAAGISAAVEPDVDIPVTRDFKLGHAIDRAESFDQLGGNGFRRSLKLPREMERDRDRQLAERGLLRLFKSGRSFDTVSGTDIIGDTLGNGLFDDVEH